MEGRLPTEVAVAEGIQEQLPGYMQDVIAEALAIFKDRAIYDRVPFWHRHPFGDISYAQEIASISGRIVAILSGDMPFTAKDLEDKIFDLINYCVMWQVWRNARGRQHGVMSQVEIPKGRGDVMMDQGPAPIEEPAPKRKKLKLPSLGRKS